MYPSADPRTCRWMPVTDGHELCVRQFGSPGGIAVLVLHGGPGSGFSPLLARFFDPARYRVIAVDQRGAGLSRPAGDVQHNTVADLLADLRRVRHSLNIHRWLVVGGSWGATLALLHAIDDPQAVTGLLLRNVFLARDEDVAAFLGDTLPPVDELAEVFENGGHAAQQALALRWWQHEQSRSGSMPGQPPEIAALVQRYRIQSHYLRNRFGLHETPLLERCRALRKVPTLLLHGSEDKVCPLQGAELLQQHVPHAQLRRVPGAGHDPAHPAMAAAMVQALDAYAAGGNSFSSERNVKNNEVAGQQFA